MSFNQTKALEYKENSPILKEMRKPQLMLVKHENFGLKRLKARMAASKKLKVYR